MSKLPAGWAFAEFAAVADIKLGKMLDKTKNRGEPTPYLRNLNVRWNTFDLDDVSHMRMSSEERASLSIRNGDILVCEGGEPGRSAVWDRGPTELTFQKALMRVRPHEGIDPRLLTTFLRKAYEDGELERHFTGTTIKHLPQAALSQVTLPLAPAPEQRRIVAKIDSLTGKSRRACNYLDHIPRLVEKYKQAVLAAAFRGDLTREWRKLHGGPKWRITTLGEVVTIASGQTPKGIEERLQPEGEIPWFKVSSMNEPSNLLGLRTSQFQLSRQDVHALGLRIVRAGSVAFPKRGGAIATNKKRRLLVDGALDLNLMVLTAQDIAPEFLWWWMQMLDLATISNGSNVPQINNGDVSPLAILVPPPAEQKEIAKLVGAAFARIDRLSSNATSARKLIEYLDQAVLAKAFRGELVPQHPADEPASVLLERIRAERNAVPKAKRGRKAQG